MSSRCTGPADTVALDPEQIRRTRNLEAIDFLRRFNTEVFAHFRRRPRRPRIYRVVSRCRARSNMAGSVSAAKWNMGWMHDTLNYISKDPIHRKYHHGDILFGLHYAFSENFILPLSHDKAWCTASARSWGACRATIAALCEFARLLQFHVWSSRQEIDVQGCEFGQEREWAHDHSLDWHLLGTEEICRHPEPDPRPQPPLPRAAGAASTGLRSGAPLNGSSLATPATTCSPDPQGQCASALPSWSRTSRRTSTTTTASACLFTGKWHEVLNSDSAHYGGSNVGNTGEVLTLSDAFLPAFRARARPLPPLAVAIFLVPEKLTHATEWGTASRLGASWD